MVTTLDGMEFAEVAKLLGDAFSDNVIYQYIFDPDERKSSEEVAPAVGWLLARNVWLHLPLKCAYILRAGNAARHFPKVGWQQDFISFSFILFFFFLSLFVGAGADRGRAAAGADTGLLLHASPGARCAGKRLVADAACRSPAHAVPLWLWRRAADVRRAGPLLQEQANQPHRRALRH